MEQRQSDDQVRQNGVTFEPLHRESTLASRVTHEIESSIMAGHLKPGDSLASERDMSEQFGVSRTVIREAIRSLVAKGLLEVQTGSGTVVSSPTVESVTQSIAHFLHVRPIQFDYKKVLEIRYALEMAIAEIAAQRILPAEVEEIEGMLYGRHPDQSSPDEVTANDVEFHTTLALATHNELFPLMLGSVIDFIRMMNELASDVLDKEVSLDRYLPEHQNIFQKVKTGDSAGARELMHDHLRHAEEMMDQIMLAMQDGDGAIAD